jgi:hypothetical protein
LTTHLFIALDQQGATSVTTDGLEMLADTTFLHDLLSRRHPSWRLPRFRARTRGKFGASQDPHDGHAGVSQQSSILTVVVVDRSMMQIADRQQICVLFTPHVLVGLVMKLDPTSRLAQPTASRMTTEVLLDASLPYGRIYVSYV